MTLETSPTPAATADDIPEIEPARKPKESESILEQKWGQPTMSVGFTVVPSVILRAQARLHIDALELAVLIHLLDHWWKPGDMPWPAKKLLADRLGVSAKTIQRALKKLEDEGLIRRDERYRQHGGRTSNRYDLSPLVEKLKPLAEEIDKANKEAEALKRSATRPGHRTRKRPAGRGQP